MAFTFLTDEQMHLKETYRANADKVIAPRVKEVDETDRFPPDLIQALIAPPFSLTTLSIPKKYGGLEMTKVDVCVIAEEIGYVLPALIPFLEIAQLYTYVIKLGGTEEQIKRFFGMMVDGAVGCYALTDEGPGSDPSSMKTVAEKDGDGFILRGKKRITTFADMADLYAIFAKEDPDKGAKGISAFIVEKGTPGLTLDDHVEYMGLKGHRAYNLTLDGVKVPAENRIGGPGEGLKLAFRVLMNTRVSLSWGYIGLARAAYEAALEFAGEREVFGKKIAAYEAIRFPLAELATEIDAARLLAYRAAVLSDRGVKHRKETSMAKLYAGEVLVKAADLANRIHGGFGANAAYPVERYLRDAYTWVAAQGTREVHKLIISQEIFQDRRAK